ncbi:hypothetical protein AHiyo8_51800 [Arthrobacter sp. Hiyo8]|nr:hypothetical protein AHiyo8_51800 [Arthrobacter sp. Hiyo8]GAP57516.1 hypothetical protein AHiyo1_03800 [Arthrobacter sp. Hiyo1]
MRHQVVDRVERLARGNREGLGRADTHHERAGQSGSGRYGNGIDIVQRYPCLVQSFLQRGNKSVQVGTGSDLRNDTAKTDVLIHRRGHGVGQQRGSADNPDAGFVAGRLDPQHERLDSVGAVHSGVPSVSVSLMMRASVPSR